MLSRVQYRTFQLSAKWPNSATNTEPGKESETRLLSIAHIVIDNPPVNATSQAVRQGLQEAIAQASVDHCTHGLITCTGRTFVAGGDITEFGSPPQEPHLPDVYSGLENSPVIWAAALYGSVLGGGLELALACDVRVADINTQFGLPEVNLGLIPGAGGTQRLPRLVGIELATEMACQAKIIGTQDFLAAGGLTAVHDDANLTSAGGDNSKDRATVTDNTDNYLADQNLDSGLPACALEHLLSIQSKPTATSRLPLASPSSDYFSKQHDLLIKRSKGATAPLDNLEAIQWATDFAFVEGQPRERERHLALRNSEQSIALRHAFFSEREVSRPAILLDDNNKLHKGLTLDNVGVIGGGLMGSGICAASLMAGYSVTMIETSENAAAEGRERVTAILESALKRGKLNKTAYKNCVSKFSASDSYSTLAACDLVIEAVFEDLTVKQHVFQTISQQVSDTTLLATNTSYLDPLSIFSGIKNPSRTIGLHFFSPAHIMKLLEIVQTPATSVETIATAFGFAKRLKKTGVLSGICDGFIGNRILASYRRQADYMLADGALPQQIDQAMRAFGMPMGPYELQDLTGLQIAWANRQRQAATRASNERYVNIADTLCEMDRLGQRSGCGWYRYEPDNRKPIDDTITHNVVLEYSQQHNIERQTFSDQDIQQRLLAVMANEGAKIVEEDVASRELDVDIVKLQGFGFPRWRGGPMHYAEQIGIDRNKGILRQVVEQSPNSWVVAEKYK